jgi:hypothetical protein
LEIREILQVTAIVNLDTNLTLTMAGCVEPGATAYVSLLKRLGVDAEAMLAQRDALILQRKQASEVAIPELE